MFLITLFITVPSLYRIGINLISRQKTQYSDEELIDYLATILQIPRQAINITHVSIYWYRVVF